MTAVDGFSDPVAAMRLRDAITKRVISVLDQERPPYQYGTVTAIDPDFKRAWVQFADSGDPVPVNCGAIIPTAVGVVVRVAGNRGDRFIVDVMGGAATLTDPSSTDVDAPTGFLLDGGIGAVTAHWDAVDGATRYRLQLAADAAFTVNVRQYDLYNTVFTEYNLNPANTVYGRAAVLTNGGAGQWSDVDDAVVEDWPIPPPTDGAAPAYSPDPTCTSGIGYIMAEWVPVPNLDPVTYKVYGDVVSGFAADASTYLGQVTDSSFFFIRNDANGDPLPYGVNFFVRIIAGDQDGDAPQSAQGFASADQVQTGDVGRIDTSLVHDGLIPPAPTVAPVVTSGIGYLYVQWNHVVNADPVTYEVHISTVSGFLPGPNTLIGETPSNRFFVRNVGSGLGGGTLQYGITYYVVIRPKDADGTANPGPQGSGFTVKTDTVDIATGAITAASAIIADAAIGSAKIQDAAITNLKVADAAISSAKIQNLAVGTAQIADAAILSAKIGNLQVTDAKISDLNVSKLQAGVISSQEIILSNSVASILRSSNFVSGSAGWRIRGDGSAEFSGVTVRGSIDASTITGSNISGGTIISPNFQTASSGARVRMGSALTAADEVQFIGPSGSIGSLRNAEFALGAPTSLRLSAGGIIDLYQSGGQNFVSITAAGGINLSGLVSLSQDQLVIQGVSVIDGGRNLQNISSFSGAGGQFTVNSGGAISAQSLQTTGLLTVNGTANFNSTTNLNSITVLQATGSAASAVNYNGFGQIFRVTSSMRYKKNILDADADPMSLHDTSDLYKLRVRSWNSRLYDGDLGGRDDPLERQIGFIAEEVAAVQPLLVTMNEFGAPEGIRDGVLLFYVVKQMQELRKDVDKLTPGKKVT